MIRTVSQTQNATNAIPKTDRAISMPLILADVERGREGGSPSSGVPIQRSCGSSSQTESFPELQRKAGTRLLRKLVATTDFRRAEYLYGAVVRLCE
jgi:hypothetical protein